MHWFLLSRAVVRWKTGERECVNGVHVDRETIFTVAGRLEIEAVATEKTTDTNGRAFATKVM